MDRKEHVATLCALGTVGAAAAGLVFGAAHNEELERQHVLSPGKRKRPGSSTSSWPRPADAPLPTRRSVSYPATPSIDEHDVQSTPVQPPWKRWTPAPGQSSLSKDYDLQDEPPSRGSSRSRMSILRPRTAASRSTIDHRESSSSSGWIKRLSSFSSHNGSSASSLHFKDGVEPTLQADIHKRPVTSVGYLPNKLVKRSFSQRGLSTDEAQGHILRRPATSHQRSQTFKDILLRPVRHVTTNEQQEQDSLPATAPSPSCEKRSWSPYFTTFLPRKRRKSETATATAQIRVISLPTSVAPVIMLGADLDFADGLDDDDEGSRFTVKPTAPALGDTRKPRHSLSSLRRIASRRRNFTDPSVHLSRTDALGTISPIRSTGKDSASSHHSAHAESIPTLSPEFASSPPLSQHSRRFHFRPRTSISASDPPTTSSDIEGRVFSDAESTELRSDTNYDSIATRTTTASVDLAGTSKLETIFAVRASEEVELPTQTWQTLNQDHNGDILMSDSPFSESADQVRGIGIVIDGEKSISTTSTHDDAFVATPPRTVLMDHDDFDTPMQFQSQRAIIDSSPPLLPFSTTTKEYDRVEDMLHDMTLDGSDYEWSSHVGTNDDYQPSAAQTRHDMPSSTISTNHAYTPLTENDHYRATPITTASKASIFDWSEHQRLTAATRPKTVHGKQANGDRSRSVGRKGAPQLHFRSQSVPVNRENGVEDLPHAAKFQTWRLGHKPVSEEWSDDFEFDDAAEMPVNSPAIETTPHNFRDSIRSVKIPQAIIDRQPSVHLQFGQVQEFMALVEELKRLRTRGAELDLLHGHAKHLWEDAENIISLATINDEETTVIVSSPASSDPFLDVTADNLPIVYKPQTRRLTTTGRRSVSTVATPSVTGRARGESLAQARHFLQAMHEVRNKTGSSPMSVEVHRQRKLPFDTQDLKDLVVRSGAITRALKDEVRRAEGVMISPQKPPPSRVPARHPLNELFIAPQPHETSSSPCPPFKPGLPKSRSANGYLNRPQPGPASGPFSSPMTLTAMV